MQAALDLIPHYALRFTALVSLVTLLSAAQLLPFLDLLRHSHRSAGFDDHIAKFDRQNLLAVLKAKTSKIVKAA